MTGTPGNDESAPPISAAMQQISLMAKRLYGLHRENAHTAFTAFNAEYSQRPTMALAEDIARLSISIRYSEASIRTSTISNCYKRRSKDSYPQFALQMSMAKAASVGAWVRSMIVDHSLETLRERSRAVTEFAMNGTAVNIADVYDSSVLTSILGTAEDNVTFNEESRALARKRHLNAKQPHENLEPFSCARIAQVR
jgi:hypothetical protein